ncbi:hypothetical protein OPQ81_001203 [Rhizoctonia solani]|nr:hypothetical protein OPQ81_001203 [Rhizoctonia solani]
MIGNRVPIIHAYELGDINAVLLVPTCNPSLMWVTDKYLRSAWCIARRLRIPGATFPVLSFFIPVPFPAQPFIRQSGVDYKPKTKVQDRVREWPMARIDSRRTSVLNLY